MNEILKALSITETIRVSKKQEETSSICKLKILDISQNITQIGILHNLRQMLSSNTELNAFSFSGFHHFNERAYTSLMQSLSQNTSLQTLDLGNLTQL
jgi:hypothetical protein